MGHIVPEEPESVMAGTVGSRRKTQHLEQLRAHILNHKEAKRANPASVIFFQKATS